MTNIHDLYDIHPNFIDKDALGFSARVSKCISMKTGDEVAFKALRLQHLADHGVWERFVIEVRLLELLKEQPAIVELLDCGFVSDLSKECPTEGEIISLEEDVEGFTTKIDEFSKKHWRPYLVLELMKAKNSLLMLARGANGNHDHPFRLPTEEAINLSMQFLEFLVEMHHKDAIYVDFKPEHAYWDGLHLRVIDFNVSMFLDKTASASSKELGKRTDLQNFIKGVLYTAFTGRDVRYQDQAPIPAPSDPNAVNNKFANITYLDFGMQETLLPQLVTLMNKSLKPDALITAESLLEEFRKCAAVLGWSNIGYLATDDAVKKRNNILKGLAALREGQQKIQEACEYFLEAELYNTVDKESARLYHETSAFYQNRVLP